MITKDRLLQTIQDLPDKFSLDELLDRVILLQKVETGLEQSKTEQIKTTEEAREQLKKWLK